GSVQASGGVTSTFTTTLFTNNATGQLSLLGANSAVTITGNMSNAGTINMANGATNNTTTINGNYQGVNGVVAVDFNRTNGGSADRLNIGGTASGITTVNFTNQMPGSGGFLTKDGPGTLVIVSTANAGAAQFNQSANPAQQVPTTVGFVDYTY